MAITTDDLTKKRTFRRYRDGDHVTRHWQAEIFQAGYSHKCPTYVQRTAPCQGSCPAGEDIRGWLAIARGLDQPGDGVAWGQYAFERLTAANPFPAIMGRVCPAPCEGGCNRSQVDEAVGINAIEQFIGDTALKAAYRFAPPPQETGRRVAIIGGGVAGLSCAYQLRRRGHIATIFERQPALGGMLRYGLPNYRVPSAIVDGEINRILAMGVDARLGVQVGRDIKLEALEQFDAVFWSIGTQVGRKLSIPGADAPNCVGGIEFLRDFNSGRMSAVPARVVVIGGGDTSIDVTTVARKIAGFAAGAVTKPGNYTADTVFSSVAGGGQHVVLTTVRPVDQMRATAREVADARSLNVEIHGSVMPIEVLKDASGRARAVRFAECESRNHVNVPKPGGKELTIDADLVVFAVGQAGDFEGLEAFDNGRGAIAAGAAYEVPGHPGHFVGGDIITPHLLATAIGHGAIAAESIDRFLAGDEPARRPKVDKHHFNLLEALRRAGVALDESPREAVWGTSDGHFAVHNFENRAGHEIIPAESLFLGYFEPAKRHEREERRLAEVFASGGERIQVLGDAESRAEADRCMSCGMCFECDNCLVYCPQTAVQKTSKAEHAIGRYVTTDYSRCIGCHICRDVCPTGYIQMGLGE